MSYRDEPCECGARVAVGWAYCPFCGKNLPTHYCPTCEAWVIGRVASEQVRVDHEHVSHWYECPKCGGEVG